jgi:hypothetical protein
MRKTIVFVILFIPVLSFCQLGIGLKAGLNFANVTGASSINSSSQTGFMAGIFLAPSSKSIISSRTELIYSRQGYSFKNSENTGNVNLDYIILPQLMGINITKFVTIQLGAQMAFLLNAKADSSTTNSGGIPTGPAGPYSSVAGYYNKFDYGFAVGGEIHPFKGLLIGARYNISLGKLYSSAMTGQSPSFSSIDAKSNVVQVFAGWKFGGDKSKKKQK